MSEQTKLPYVNNPKKLESYFKRIKEVEVPAPKFSYDFLENVCLFKSHADRTLMPLLKKMGLLEQEGKPTEAYSNLRNDEDSKKIIADGTRKAFSELFRRNINLHTLGEEQIKGYVKSITGLGEEASTLPLITKTVMNLIQLGDYSEAVSAKSTTKEQAESKKLSKDEESQSLESPFALNYTISINLPETTNEEVYEKIFSSIKKTLMTK